MLILCLLAVEKESIPFLYICWFEKWLQLTYDSGSSALIEN